MKIWIMNPSTVYLLIAIVALVAIVIFAFLIKPARQRQKLSPLASLAFGFVLEGIFFGEERWLGYGLMGGWYIVGFCGYNNKTPGEKLSA
jgi:hypothetical protein